MLLTLDSSTLTGQTSHDFSVDFSSPINVNNGIHELALIKANLWYSFYNVSTQYNNNTFQYTNNLAQVRTVTIPNGNYTIIQLNNYLHYVMKNNGDYTVVSGVDTFDIEIEPNYSTLRTIITLTNGYIINLSTSKFNELLGWNSGVYSHNGSLDGQNVANINNSINTLQIHCDIISQSYKNSVMGDVLYTFVPNKPPGSNLEIVPETELIYLPIRIPDYITKIRMYITDQNNRIIDFNGEPTTYLLHLRKRPEIYSPGLKNI